METLLQSRHIDGEGVNSRAWRRNKLLASKIKYEFGIFLKIPRNYYYRTYGNTVPFLFALLFLQQLYFVIKYSLQKK